jgi:hypothetical protein
MTMLNAPPTAYLRIQGDPTSWAMTGILPVMPAWSQDTGIVPLNVVGPLIGTLLLAPRQCGSLALTPPPIDVAGGWVPCIKLEQPYLYLPSASGLAAASPGYLLAAPDNDLATLQQRIVTAVQERSVISVAISSVGRPGVVLLDGASLPFVVLGQAESGIYPATAE